VGTEVFSGVRTTAKSQGARRKALDGLASGGDETGRRRDDQVGAASQSERNLSLRGLAVQELLGHSSVTTTQRYTHMDTDNLRQQVPEMPANRPPR